jgi:uncharacterized protein YkwD
MRRRWSGIAAALLFVGCTVPLGDLPLPPAPGPVSPSEGPGAELPHAAVSVQVLGEVNRAREGAGVRPLLADAALDRAAAHHASELARREVLDHESTDPARRTIALRVDAVGVRWRRIAENLAQVSGGSAAVGPQVARLWLNSPGHRANMLEPAYTRSGVGVARDRAGLWYVVQLYVLPAAGE